MIESYYPGTKLRLEDKTDFLINAVRPKCEKILPQRGREYGLRVLRVRKE